ncbi:MAG: hypothetical protein NC898_01695 [Candidatus Omnitrophica bacterium]|nr:hypothetical protein [Candidatus Omnitrophota bacterium]
MKKVFLGVMALFIMVIPAHALNFVGGEFKIPVAGNRENIETNQGPFNIVLTNSQIDEIKNHRQDLNIMQIRSSLSKMEPPLQILTYQGYTSVEKLRKLLNLLKRPSLSGKKEIEKEIVAELEGLLNSLTANQKIRIGLKGSEKEYYFIDKVVSRLAKDLEKNGFTEVGFDKESKTITAKVISDEDLKKLQNLVSSLKDPKSKVNLTQDGLNRLDKILKPARYFLDIGLNKIVWRMVVPSGLGTKQEVPAEINN